MSTPSATPIGGALPLRGTSCLGVFDLKRLNSTAEVARLAGVSVSSIRRWRDEDPTFPLPRILGDRTLRWPPDEVLGWLDSRPRVDGAASVDGTDPADGETTARRARDEAASRSLSYPSVPLPARPR